ncbi:MAG: RNA polymerase subunit sigma, partial [Planctomycetales bacterium]|nr:RNA polymerase subunit sigma [Planctomycetales bacterium]
MPDVTEILNHIQCGDADASQLLREILYGELHRMAAHQLAKEQAGQTLQATALVHEAYLRLVGNGDQQWNSRGHFFAAAAEAMRRILVDQARKKLAKKRGGDGRRVSLVLEQLAGKDHDERILALNEALSKLEQQDELKANLVKLRFFAGLTVEQTA